MRSQLVPHTERICFVLRGQRSQPGRQSDNGRVRSCCAIIVRMGSEEQIGLKITREQRLHFSYPDPLSAKVEGDYYGSGLKLPAGFTGFKTRRERLADEAQQLRPQQNGKL